MGLITAESKQLVDAFERAKYAGGVALYGPALVKWPARMVDALVVIEQERNRVENARLRAEVESNG